MLTGEIVGNKIYLLIDGKMQNFTIKYVLSYRDLPQTILINFSNAIKKEIEYIYNTNRCDEYLSQYIVDNYFFNINILDQFKTVFLDNGSYYWCHYTKEYENYINSHILHYCNSLPGARGFKADIFLIFKFLPIKN